MKLISNISNILFSNISNISFSLVRTLTISVSLSLCHSLPHTGTFTVTSQPDPPDDPPPAPPSISVPSTLSLRPWNLNDDTPFQRKQSYFRLFAAASVLCVPVWVCEIKNYDTAAGSAPVALEYVPGAQATHADAPVKSNFIWPIFMSQSFSALRRSI